MSGREVTIAAYVAILLIAVAIDLAARAGARVPSFGEVVTLVSRSWVVRFALLALWWWLGWHFLARSGPAPV
ncbi:MAG: DUF6186 family protein [Pseudonocardiaceae bacterium]